MLLTSLDLDPYASGRSLDVVSGDLFDLGLRVDLLVISAFEGFYEGLPGSLIAQLRDHCGVDVASLKPALDFRGAPLVRGWVSEPLSGPSGEPRWPHGSRTRFQRLAIIESPREQDSGLGDWPAFNQLFSLLALLPLNGIQCRSVASPLLSAGNHGIAPARLMPALTERCRDRLRHLPDLERLVIFDRNKEAARLLAERINKDAKRSESQTTDIQLKPGDLDIKSLSEQLKGLASRPEQGINQENIHEILLQLSTGVIKPVPLGSFLRRLTENLLRISLKRERVGIHEGLSVLKATEDCDTWVISCLHQIRVYANLMVHDNTPLVRSKARQHEVLKEDVLMVLMALHRALKSYPWLPPGRIRYRSPYQPTARKPEKPIRRQPLPASR